MIMMLSAMTTVGKFFLQANTKVFFMDVMFDVMFHPDDNCMMLSKTRLTSTLTSTLTSFIDVSILHGKSESTEVENASDGEKSAT